MIIVDGPEDWKPSPDQSRAVREFLEGLNEDPSTRRIQKKVSTTDPGYRPTSIGRFLPMMARY